MPCNDSTTAIDMSTHFTPSATLLLISIMILTACQSQVHDKDEDPWPFVDPELRNDLKVRTGPVSMTVARDTLFWSYDIYNDEDTAIYANSYVWTIQSGMKRSFLLSRPHNTGNLLTIYRERIQGYYAEYVAPGFPWVSPQFSMIRPHDKVRMEITLAVPSDSIAWVYDGRTTLNEIALWMKMPDTLARFATITEADTVRVRVRQSYGSYARGEIHLVNSERPRLSKKDFDSLWVALYQNLAGSVYSADSGTFRVRTRRERPK